MTIPSLGQLLGLYHAIFTPPPAKMLDATTLARFSNATFPDPLMQTVTCRFTTGIEPAQALVPTIAAITAALMILIASSTSAAAGGSGRENRPWPWYFLLKEYDRAASVRGSHWFIKGLERRRRGRAEAAGGPRVR